DHVVLAQRRERLQPEERQIVAAQLGLEIDPRRERPLAGPLRVAVHDRVQDLEAVGAHAEAVGVREGEAQLAANLPVVLGDAVQFAADVLRWHLDPRQHAVDGFLQGRVEHGDRPFSTGWGHGTDYYAKLVAEPPRRQERQGVSWRSWR